MASRKARLVLPGSGTSAATADVEHRSRGDRAVRAASLLLGSWVVTPLVFFVPPHVVWPPLVFVAGLVLAWRAWTREYVVNAFEGSCPRCGEPLKLEPGSGVRKGARLECFSCHREPQLVLEGEESDA